MSHKIDEAFIARDLERWKQDLQEEGIQPSQDEIDKHIAELKHPENLEPAPQFNGFSFIDMHKMLIFPLEEGCPVQLRTLTEEQISEIPIMRQIFHLMNALSEEEIQLSSRGYLPVKIVAELYELGNPSRVVEYKRKNQANCDDVSLICITLEETGLVKKRQGKLSLTAKGKKMLKDHTELLKTVIGFLLLEFNTGYFERPPGSNLLTGNVGKLYSLWLLHHFGTEWHKLELYGKEYLKAFPFVLDRISYVNRVYEHLFRIIGLCQFKQTAKEAPYNEEVRKTPLVDLMFSFEEPAEI